MMKEEETSEQWLEWICEAIKKIRNQKQRPSLERVINAIKLHTPYTDNVITSRLEDFVEKGQILKILNKGKASFKDPGTNQNRFIVIDKETDLVKIVVKAVKDLDAGDGTQFKHIEKYVPQSHCLDVKPDVDLSSLLKISLKRAVERNLLLQDGKTYKALPEDPKSLKSPKTPVVKKAKPEVEKEVITSPKTPGRKKKVNEETPKKSGLPICSECLGTAKRNKLGAEEALSICNGCGASIHPSCAAKGDLFTVLISKGNIWHCEECATCTKCRSTDKVCIWKCGACERGYHLDCMSPAVDKKSKTPWKCCYCVEGKPEKNSDAVTSHPNTPTTPMTSPRKQKSLRTQQLRSLSKAARAIGKKAQKRSLSIESSSEDGNDEPNQSPSYPTSYPPSGGRRIEISDTISKEKQKFFRCSAFIKRSNAVKTDREPEAPKLNAITPVTPLTQFPRHIPPLNPNSSEMRMPFGSDDSDEPWGFAAVKFEAAKVGNAKEKGRRWKKDAPKHKSPSSLVKSAVNSKIHGIERKKLIAEGRAAHRLTLDEWSSERHSDAAAITSIISNELPPGVTQKDLETFKIARENASKLTKPNLASADLDISGSGTLRCPASIEFGQHHIHTWYSSPFPQEYARLGKLFLCEYCLKYTKSKAVLKRHLHKCTWRHPPGTEIYRHENLSVFEVDGNVAKFYCQNLCLLAKLFLDHKTLYYDVEPFLFYVLTKNDEQGFHLVGYFSKEKHCLQKYNVSCIMTLPHYQRQGFGRFLIDFSYLLSKQEGQPGTPEKPLSDLGRVSYHAYWKSVILEYLNEHRDEDFSIKELCKESGVKAQDIAEMLQIMGMIRPSKVEGESKVVLAVDWSLVDAHAEKVKKSIRIKIEPECLRWTPLIPTLINPYKIINSENEEDEDKGDSDEEDNKVDVEEVDSKPQKSEKVELKTPKVESKSPKSEKVEIKTPKIQLDLKKVEKTESKVEKEDEIAVSTPEVKTAPKSTRVKQSLLPALFKKQKEMAEVAKVEEPSIEKRRRGTKKKYTEIEEDDDETSQVEPPPEKKKKKTIEPSPLIKPSRLKIPETPVTPMEVAETPETVNGRRTRRPRLTDTKEDEKLEEEEEAEVEDKTPKLSRRQIAARERWAKKKQKVEEVQEENDVDVEEPEEETPAKNTRKKPKRDMKEEVEEDVETPKKEKKAKKKELPKEKVKRSKKIETDSEGEKSDEIESRISKRKSLRGASKVEEVERRRGRSRLAKTKKEVPTRKSLRVMADDTDTQSSEVDDDVQPETPPRPRSAGNSAISSDEDVAEPQKPKLEEESINNINNDDSLPPPILPPAVSDRESQEDEIEKKKKEEELKKEEEKKKKEEERKKKEEERKKKEEEKRKEEEEKRKEELRKKQEEELRRKEEEEIARKKHEEELRIKQEEKRREEELKRKEEEEIRLKEEEEKKRKEEEMRRIQEEENRKKLEEEMRKKEELRLKEEEEKKKQEEERRKREEEEFLRRKKEEEERQRMEEELRRKEAEERKRIEDEERRRREDDERRKREEEERRKREDEERRKREEEARKKEMLKMPSSISVPIPNYPMPQSAPLIHPVGPPLIHHPPLLHPVKSELKPEEYDITKSLKKDEKVDKEKGFTEVKKPMEVDLTEDSRSPATKDETHDKNLKKAQKPYDPKHPYPPPVKDKKEKKHEEHKREELKSKVPVYNEHPNQVHPMYTGCGEMDVNMMEPQSNEMLEQQRLQQQYSDCAQQSLLHHHHLTPSPHMNMVYQQQRKQVARSSGSNNQRHHHPSPPSHYHQSPNYIMPQNSPYVSVLSHRVQNPQRISPSCSVSSPNLYFQQQNSPNSLVQLQKLTNGLESIPGHGTPPPRVDLTPPPNHSTPPNPYKYQYQRHITPAPQRPHNVLQYNTFNNYSRPQSPSVAGYIANSASFINQAQLPMQMMQPQYPQDPQQNTMYPNVPYGYHINSPLMQPLNGTMRR